ncbi:MAG: thiamine phosphate synthase [Campylobacterales bacterium]
MKSYLITDPRYYGTTPEELRAALEGVSLRHTPWAALLRDKEHPCYADMAAVFVEVVRRIWPNTLAVIHSDTLLASTLGADALHLPFRLLSKLEEAQHAGLQVIVSVHSLQEAIRAEEAGADYIVVSPFFPTPGKGEPLGLEKINEILATIKKPIIALGGIVTQAQIDAVARMGIDRFASIRYFVS